MPSSIVDGEGIEFQVFRLVVRPSTPISRDAISLYLLSEGISVKRDIEIRHLSGHC